ncbi:unnamed protein product [Caenorhabditis brenneri]
MDVEKIRKRRKEREDYVDAKKSDKPWTCKSAVDYHYRRCISDRYSSFECDNYIKEAIAKYCKDKKNTSEICITTAAPSTTTTTTTTTTKAPIIEKSHVITISAIGGIFLLFFIGFLIICCIQKRKERKREEAEAAGGWGGLWTSSTVSEGSKASDVESSAEKSTVGTTKTGMKTAKSSDANSGMKTAKSGGLFGTTKKKQKSVKPGAPMTPTSPGIPQTPKTPQEVPKGSKEATTSGAQQHTGNTATIRPLIWNKQAASNVYY